jgi:signal transduction histidine kinase
VVWNLLSNAVKFTGAGGHITLAIQSTNNHAELSVADTGIGIAPAFLPFVFDKFRQADGSYTRQHGGLGLGLAIARHLTELHGGSIEARSDGEGHGALFTVRLPLASTVSPSV